MASAWKIIDDTYYNSFVHYQRRHKIYYKQLKIWHSGEQKILIDGTFSMVNPTNFIYDILQRQKKPVKTCTNEQPLFPFMLVVLSTGMNLTVILHLKTQQLWSIYRFEQTNATTKMNWKKYMNERVSVLAAHEVNLTLCKALYIMRCTSDGYVFHPMCYEFDLFYIFVWMVLFLEQILNDLC